MSAAERRALALQVLWNLRGLGLFLVGPVVGVTLVGAVFGLPRTQQALAGVMFLFALALYASLARGEWRRLSAGR